MRQRTLVRGLALLFVLASLVSAAEEGKTALFNGKNLDGWQQNNGTATYRIEGDCIVGKTSEGSPNSFLCTTKEYGDFELTFEVKVDNELNSGVQIRSKTKDGTRAGRVHGPQVEIAIDGNAGFIYGEALGTNWISSKAEMENPAAKTAFKKGDWNSYRVLAKGPSIKTWINGIPVADTSDTKSKMDRGFIGLQVHGIRKGTGPYEVRFKNILLKELK